MENSNGFRLNNTAQPSLPYSLLNPCYGESCVCQNSFGSPFGVNADSVGYDESRKIHAKMARANRRQMLANKKTNPSSSHSKKPSKKTYSSCNKGGAQDERIFYTRDNVKLSFLLRKMLTCSDVGDLGRILLPKREVEENLPGLATKEGVDIVLREVYTNTEWPMKYRFWANQKGNIYLFDQCAEFVKKNSLEAGDHLELYHDEHRNLYFTVQKKEKHPAQDLDLHENVSYVAMMLEATEEDDLSWSELMEELNYEE